MSLIWPVTNHRAALTPHDHDVTQPEVPGFETPTTGIAQKTHGNSRKPLGNNSGKKTGSEVKIMLIG